MKVVNAQGEPQVGVAVKLVKAQYGALSSMLEDQTNEQGIATLFNVNDPMLTGYGSEGFALIAGNPPPPNEPTLQPRAKIPAYQEIVLAATGSLVLRVQDFLGDPIVGPRKIRVHLVKPGQDPLHVSKTKAFTLNTESRDGSCLISGVPAGFPIRVQIDFEEIGDWETFNFGPLKADQFGSLTLRQRREYSALSFRVVDANGKPITDQQVDCAVKGELQFQSGYVFQEKHFTTDAEGRGFLLLAQPTMKREEVMIHERQLQVSIAAENEKNTLTGRIDISRDFPIRRYDLGDYDLGDITLKPKEILAQGQVADVVGKPIVGARVHIAQSAFRNTDGIAMESFSHFLGETATTDANGSFVIYGEAAEGVASVNANKTGYPGTSTEWLGPRSPHSLVMDAGFIIQGEILLPEGLESKGVNVTFHMAGSDKDKSPKGSDYGPVDGLFRIVGAPNEFGYLQIGTGSGWPFPVLATIENVLPWRPSEEGDPRLSPLDLRNVLHTFHVDVVDASGDLISDVMFLSVTHRNGGTTSVGHGSVNGKGFFLSATEHYDVTVKAKGYRTVETTLRNPETIVTLQQSLEAGFELAWMPKLKSLRSVVLSLSPVDGTGSTGLLEDSLFDKDGKLQTKISRPGRYEVSLGIHVNHSSSSQSLENENGDPIVIEVLESGNVQTYHFDPPQDFYDYWLKQ